VRSAEPIWRRRHIVRLRLAGDDGSVVLKRGRSDNFGGRVRGFAAELAALEFLNAEETAVAPRLIGASADLLVIRPRLLTWLGSFADAASQTEVLPRLRSLAEALRSLLRERWPSAVAPSYPALARPGEPLARLPSGWSLSD